MRHVVTLAFLFLVAITSPRVAWAEDADCWKKTDEARLRACTQVINTTRLFGKRINNTNLASIYYNRGHAYDNMGQYDKAIADYDKAIGLRRAPRAGRL